MSLLTVAQNVADEIGLKQPGAIAGVDTATARRFLAMANRAGDSLGKEKWGILTTDHSFSMVSGTQAYTAPADFDSMISDTQWDQTENRQIFGGMSAEQWESQKGSAIVPIIHKRFRVRGTVIEFVDTVDTTDTIAYEYRSRNWAQDAAGDSKAKFTLDTDSARMDETILELGLMWRMKRALGLDFISDRGEYEIAKNRALAQDHGLPTINQAGGERVLTNLPEGNFNV